ncbi:conserved phage C-terminal domain-containing protein [Clostridia bacterium]|nr:conserved phage C-terminal domain-containing protein [Clostridia bacterium]
MDSESCTNVLNLLSSLGAIDKELWDKKKIVWSQNFVDGIADVYKKRYAETPRKPSFRTENLVSDTENTQSKVKESKVKDKEILSGKKNPTPPPYKKIIDYLNKKTGKQFRSTSKASKRLIQARYAEGFKEQEFIQVIDNQVAAWKAEKKMVAYLRPQTLFGSKFESYLNNSPNNRMSRPNSKYDHLVVNMMEDEDGN